MAVRDLLWGCPLCRSAGAIRPGRRGERCRSCGATFRRDAGSIIAAERDGERQLRSAAEWLAILGPVESPDPDRQGRILGPERVRVKHTRTQKPLSWDGELLGWVETYDRPRAGTMSLHGDGLHFQPDRGEPIHWMPGDITGLQPASSSLQLGLHQRMASVRFTEGSVRLWTRALSDVLRHYYRRLDRDVLELQPFVRTCSIARRQS
jgi:hypothetical protein